MSRRPTFRAPFACGLMIAATIAAYAVQDALAADPAGKSSDATARVQAHLAAGEFAPAIALARQEPSRDARDVLLGQIAAAQGRSGNRNAALATAAEMDGDVSRNRSLRELSSQPVTPAPGAAGGGSEADFDSLIQLITSTVKPTSWDTVGGPGSVKGYEGGVYVDASGVLKPLVAQDRAGSLADLRARSTARDSSDVRRASPLRKVSLTRLERQVQWHLAAGKKLPDDMALLAGLERIQFVLVYPEQGDVVLAGPAADWRTDAEGRVVSAASGRPVLHLDDLVVVLRQMMTRRDARFGCSITPTQDALAKTKEFVASSSQAPLKVGQRPAWLKKLRDQMGQQTIDVYGVDPGTRVGRILVEADYRMKLVGIGLEDGVPGVESYLDSIKVPKGQAPPPMDVLRWWFTLNYDAVQTTADRDAFEIRGQGVQVLSENELLTALGERVHTGQSEPLNREFARNFTKHFPALAAKYPVYAELQNVFDLALVAALLKAESLPDRADWHMTCFSDPAQYQVEMGYAPKFVETVINHRVVNQVHILAAVSGGVRVDPGKLVAKSAIETDNYGPLSGRRTAAKPTQRPLEAWWWD